MRQDASSFLDKSLSAFQSAWHPGNDRSWGWTAAEERAGQPRSRAQGPGAQLQAALRFWDRETPWCRCPSPRHRTPLLITEQLLSPQGTSPHPFLWSHSTFEPALSSTLSHLNPRSQESGGLDSEYCLLFGGNKKKEGVLVFVIIEKSLRI